MDGFRQLGFSLGCTGGPLGTRDQAYANRNTVLIHHPVSTEIIKSNYRQPPQPHLNLPPDGGPAVQQVASPHMNLHPTAVIWIPANNGGPEEPDIHEIWNAYIIMMERAYTCDIYFIINHLLWLWHLSVSFVCVSNNGLKKGCAFKWQPYIVIVQKDGVVVLCF